MKQIELPLFKFDVGDLVKIVGKSVGEKLGEGFFGSNFYYGQQEWVESVNVLACNNTFLPDRTAPLGTKIYVILGGAFLAEDLRRV